MPSIILSSNASLYYFNSNPILHLAGLIGRAVFIMFPFPGNSRMITCSTNQSWDSSLPFSLSCYPRLLCWSHYHSPTAAAVTDISHSSSLSIDPHFYLIFQNSTKTEYRNEKWIQFRQGNINLDIHYCCLLSPLLIPLHNNPATDCPSLIGQSVLLGPMWLPLTRVYFDRSFHTCFKYSGTVSGVPS